MPSITPLTSPQLRTLHRVLLTEFKDREHELEELLRVRIGAPLDRLVSPGPMLGKIFEVIQAAERAGWTADLVRAAYEVRPLNRELGELCRELGLASDLSVQHGGTQSDEPLESVVTGARSGRSDGMFDIARWRDRLASIETRVCRVEAGGRPRGTGFLVGPDLVLTVYHNVQDVIANHEGAPGVRFRFDYRVVGDVVTEGLIVDLHPTEWLVDYSPASTDEPASASAEGSASPDELDYALLRLARPIGGEPLDGSGPAATRGWLQMSGDGPPIMVGMAVAIAQYALGGPLKVALDSGGILGMNKNGTRVRYATNTAPGAGGAPCFSADWDLLAIHVGSDRGEDGTRRFGVGVPIAAIVARMQRTGTLGVLSPEPSPTLDRRLPSAENPPPAPPPVRQKDDLQRDRWGGRPERDGREVKATITSIERSVFTFDVSVVSTDGSPLEGPIVFHLHDTFPQPVIRVRKIRDGKEATLWQVTSYGVFTVGAQVKDATGAWVGLELDLATLTDLPDHFRNK